ncbi:hypothetical protein A3K24_01960 [candidate division Kazan bacterium RIFCSPHIGHO2_01_FULL_44_14]|uniref:Uncharacterized protein n=1 Tax=candidate division Kazan bacterium RIFCSPLOWO2_01_FULL_45_19 TaxID=1798538 RepID=A0A1F4NQ68_UNCK3|nr:hypothetical protein [uncultured bacterium]AQS31012.1 hypothetical protein [uncultured bacterium]OGB73591.1 MAG: hypothetical protein A3K51_01960 [candidate division Kazan bacterium RIFCSPLOWO2_01_FULL_45_19]OGB77836.1 MAG: hypothetical protein A3K24_01960 [candidate division Kazan bacterium RIFCSPHIGHO2_01_FULL_44_14]
MGAKLVLSAALKKGDQTDTLILENGTEVPLSDKLPYPAETIMVMEVMTRSEHQSDQQTLAKQILQEIISDG